MLTKHVHLHLRLEAANEGETGLGVQQVWDAGVEVKKAFDAGVDVAFFVGGQPGRRGNGMRHCRLCIGAQEFS